MKTIEEKAEYWLNDNVAGWDDTMLLCLTVLLMEQDKETRNRCAEAVNAIALDHNTITVAHSTIMSTVAE